MDEPKGSNRILINNQPKNLKTMEKLKLFKDAMEAGGYLGGKNVNKLVNLMSDNQYVPESTDPISAIIYKSFIEIDPQEDELPELQVINYLDYAINQLVKARELVNNSY